MERLPDDEWSEMQEAELGEYLRAQQAALRGWADEPQAELPRPEVEEASPLAEVRASEASRETGMSLTAGGYDKQVAAVIALGVAFIVVAAAAATGVVLSL